VRDEKQPADQAQNDDAVAEIKHLRQAGHDPPQGFRRSN
jgi:hypothetical protein